MINLESNMANFSDPSAQSTEVTVFSAESYVNSRANPNKSVLKNPRRKISAECMQVQFSICVQHVSLKIRRVTRDT